MGTGSYNIEKLIEEGRKILGQNPKRDLTAYTVKQVKDSAEDEYLFGENMFLMGLAIGARINKNSDLAEG